MSFKVRTFPFPVLAEFNDDYESPAKFQSKAEFTIRDENGRSTPIMKYEYSLECAAIEQLVNDEKAEIVVELDCRETLYRTVIRLDTPSAEIQLDSGEMIGAVDVTFYVLATTDLAKFQPAGINTEYGGAHFSVISGDPLAISIAESAEFGFNWKSAPDLMKVHLAPDLDPFTYDFDCSASPIIIRVGERYMKYWLQTRGDAATKPHLYQGLYKDCMSAALTVLRDEPENDTPWARALVGRLEDLGHAVDPDWDFDDINTIALRIVASQGIEKLMGRENAD